MSGSREDRRRCEEIWRERLRQAEIRFQLAAAHSRQMHAEYSSGSMPSPDGQPALRKALKKENAARAEYMRVLRLFSRLILYGEHPEEKKTSETA
jgi:hypothetical protein